MVIQGGSKRHRKHIRGVPMSQKPNKRHCRSRKAKYDYTYVS